MSRSSWLLLLPLLLAYGDTWIWIWDRWTLGEYYSHGPLLPLVAVAVVYTQRARLAALSPGEDGRGWYLLGLGLLIRAAGAALTVDSLSAISLPLSCAGLVLLVGGPARLRWAAPLLGLFFLAIPMPIGLTDSVAFELKEFAMSAALGLGNLLGLGAERIGAGVRVPGQELVLPVADECGGLRSLLALTSLGYCLAFFMGSRRWQRRAILLAVAMPMAVLVNIVRITGLCFAARFVDVPFAGGTGHTLMNAFSWLLNIVLLLWLDSRLERVWSDEVEAGP